jgi:hypothetical protein
MQATPRAASRVEMVAGTAEKPQRKMQSSGSKPMGCGIRKPIVPSGLHLFMQAHPKAHAYRRYPLKHLAEVVNWIAAQQLAVVVQLAHHTKTRCAQNCRRLDDCPLVVLMHDARHNGPCRTHCACRAFRGQ